MPVKTTNSTAEEIQQQNEQVSNLRGSLESELSSDFANGLDLPASADDEVTPDEVIEEAIQPDDDEEEEEENEVEKSESEEDEDEDLIPRSKVDKRFAKLTAANRALQDQIRALEMQAQANKDPDIAKLESMSDAELVNTKRQAMARWKDEEDQSVSDRLLELVDKIDQVRISGPKKFQEEQARLYQQAALDIQNDDEIDDLKKAEPEILKIANEIYGSSKSLQSQKTGQAEALHLAASHYKRISKLSAGKSSTVQLKRENNKLKKKTSLDGKVMQGDKQKQSIRKLRDRATNEFSQFDDKLSYAKQSGILGDLSRYDTRR